MSRATENVLSEEVLEKAMRLFWRRGYFSVSVDELIAQTGLNRAAIYNRFSDKRGLFVALLKRYRVRVTDRLIAPLQAPGADLESAKTFFRQFRDVPELTRDTLGCFLVATASDSKSHDDEVVRLAAAYIEDLRRLLRSALQRAQRLGSLRPGIEPAAAADFLTGNVLGLMTVSRAPASPQVFVHHLHALEQYLSTLGSEESV